LDQRAAPATRLAQSRHRVALADAHQICASRGLEILCNEERGNGNIKPSARKSYIE
jgi:hypothetical protein